MKQSNTIIELQSLLDSVGIARQQLERYRMNKVISKDIDYRLINRRNYVYFSSAVSKLIQYREEKKAKQEKKH